MLASTIRLKDSDCFDREEGGTDGGIIVQDCLELQNNLLRGNSGNQLLFRFAIATLLNIHSTPA